MPPTPTRVRRSATVALLTAAAAVLAHGAFERPRSCRSGEGTSRDGPVRLLRIEGTVAGEQASRSYVCSARLRRPRPFHETSPDLDEALSTFRRSGRRDEGTSVLAVVADGRGGIARLQDRFDDGAQRIGCARVLADGRLGAPRPRALVAGSAVLRRSLTVSGGVIAWTTRSGATGSVPTGG